MYPLFVETISLTFFTVTTGDGVQITRLIAFLRNVALLTAEMHVSQ